MHQWNKIQSQTYLQLHNDGAGQLITKDEACSQTLVSSYRQSYLLHSQFIVSNDSSYLARQKETLKSVALAKTKAGSTQPDCVVVPRKAEEQLPRFSLHVSAVGSKASPSLFRYLAPMTMIPKQQRQRVSQFYRQVGNAVSPPCVAAVAKKKVDKIFSTSASSTDSIHAYFHTK
eukprot:scaffold17325_cov109-Skeletonema_dohrnii-CCMP3373.AAC.6